MSEQSDGLTYIRDVRDGRRPGDPFMVHSGIAVAEADAGEVVLGVTLAPEHLNHGGFAHGGFLATLMDAATGYALFTRLPPGTTPPHLEASYRYLDMARLGQPLTARARVLKAGRRIGHVRVEVRDAADRLIATGETTHAVVAFSSAPHAP